uniref:PepX_0 protein n=1 Tax=Fopius arisanus TaxID=64838 RepID=A0A0C9QU90_9HYME
MMRVLLLIGVILFPLALGNTHNCYYSVESKYLTSPKTEVPCESDCGRGEVPLPGNEKMIMRGCRDMFSDLVASFDTEGSLTSAQKKALEQLTPDKITWCKGNLCNSAHTGVSKSLLLLVITTVAAMITTN